MPTEAEKQQWIERNEAARVRARLHDQGRPMSELLEETARLSMAVDELREGVERARCSIRMN